MAKRSCGFTPADHDDPLVSRPARAARALEPAPPPQPSAESDQPGFPDPGHRPRRALPAASPAESLIPGTDQERASSTEASIGRRAMDPLPSRFTQSAPQSAVSFASSSPVEEPKPRRSAPSPSPEPALPRPAMSAYPTPAPAFGTSPGTTAACSTAPAVGLVTVACPVGGATCSALGLVATACTAAVTTTAAGHASVAARSRTDGGAQTAAGSTRAAIDIDRHAGVTPVAFCCRAADCGTSADASADPADTRVSADPADAPASANSGDAHASADPSGSRATADPARCISATTSTCRSAGRPYSAAARAADGTPQQRVRFGSPDQALAVDC